MSLCAMVTVPAPLPSSVTVTLLNVESSVSVFTNEPKLTEMLDGLSGWFVEPQIVRVTTSSANAALVSRHTPKPNRMLSNGLRRFIFPPVGHQAPHQQSSLGRLATAYDIILTRGFLPPRSKPSQPFRAKTAPERSTETARCPR